MRMPKYSIRALLLTIFISACTVTVIKWLNPPRVYSLPAVSSSSSSGVYEAFGRTYEYELNEDVLSRAPTWFRNTEDPPLSADDAINLADMQRKRLIREGRLEPENVRFEWRLGHAALVPFDAENGQWYWVVLFYAYMDQTGPRQEFGSIILMDGTVLEPVLSEHQPVHF